MKIGYVQDFNLNLLDEIKFAKDNFDFIEITFDKGFDLSEDELKKAKEELKDFLVIGHIHWKLNSFYNEHYEEIKKTINIFKEFSAKKIVMHPINLFSLDINLRSVDIVKTLCGSNLLIENMTGKYSKVEIVKEILNKCEINLCLDVGHANKSSELDNFLELKDKIKHVHLHDNVGDNDHLFFEDKDKLKNLIKKLGKDLTVSLEMFRLGNKENPNPEERKKLLLKQKEWITENG